MAVACEIKDDDGTIFHFKNHALKWLAHLTPEMTLAYAKLLGSTIRKEWQQAFAKGALEAENRKLKEELKVAYGKLYERV